LSIRAFHCAALVLSSNALAAAATKGGVEAVGCWVTCCGGSEEEVDAAETTGLSEDPVTLIVIFGRDGENGMGEISGGTVHPI